MKATSTSTNKRFGPVVWRIPANVRNRRAPWHGTGGVKLNDRQRAVRAANLIRDYWKGLGFQVKVEVHNDGSITSDMIGVNRSAGWNTVAPRMSSRGDE